MSDKLREAMAGEMRSAHAQALDETPLVEPTADERRNGWTAETLRDYHAGQKAAQSMRIDPGSALRRRIPKRAAGPGLKWFRRRG